MKKQLKTMFSSNLNPYDKIQEKITIRPQGHKTFFLLILNEHEISTTLKNKMLKNKDFSRFQTLRCCKHYANKFCLI